MGWYDMGWQNPSGMPEQSLAHINANVRTPRMRQDGPNTITAVYDDRIPEPPLSYETLKRVSPNRGIALHITLTIKSRQPLFSATLRGRLSDSQGVVLVEGQEEIIREFSSEITPGYTVESRTLLALHGFAQSVFQARASEIMASPKSKCPYPRCLRY